MASWFIQNAPPNFHPNRAGIIGQMTPQFVGGSPGAQAFPGTTPPSNHGSGIVGTLANDAFPGALSGQPGTGLGSQLAHQFTVGRGNTQPFPINQDSTNAPPNPSGDNARTYVPGTPGDPYYGMTPPNPSGIVRQPMSGSMSDWLGGGMTDTVGGIVRQPTNATLPGTPMSGGNPNIDWATGKGLWGTKDNPLGNIDPPGAAPRDQYGNPMNPSTGQPFASWQDYQNYNMAHQPNGVDLTGVGNQPWNNATTGGNSGGASSIVSQVANSIGRPDLANNPYWIDFYNKNPDANYLKEKMSKPDDGTGSTGSSAGGSLGAFLQPFTGTFTPPKGTDDPGFQFAVNQGADQLARKAAALGNLNTGGFAKDLASYTTGAALQDYAGGYNRALQTFGTNYDIFRNNQTDPYNKLMGVTGLGLNATNATTAAGSSYGNNLASLGSQFGNTQQGLTTGVGNAQAAGTIGAANALTPAISTLAPAFTSLGDWFKRHNGTPVTDTGMGTPPGMRG